ncbi:MAG: Rpn family recombination-promoting nuclease/putative transposase [bacterium]|nr:Rpn family recombination-promoting nuclease/putative transposase [bacterium]
MIEKEIYSENNDSAGDNDKKQKKILNPHDGVFTEFFDDKEIASSFIREYVPTESNRIPGSALTVSYEYQRFYVDGTSGKSGRGFGGWR